MRLFLSFTKSFILPLGFLILSSCQTVVSSPSPQKGGIKNTFSLENFNFSVGLSNDKISGWKIIDIKPAQLPYTGAIAQWSAQDRWIKLFEKSLELVNQECQQPIKSLPEIKGDQADYYKFGKSPLYPKFVRIRFSCK